MKQTAYTDSLHRQLTQTAYTDSLHRQLTQTRIISRPKQVLIFLLFLFYFIPYGTRLSAQCIHTIESKYIVFNEYAIPSEYSVDSLTNFDIINMLPEHYQVEELFCVQSDSSIKITKDYTWLESPEAQNRSLYDKVVSNKEGISLYKDNILKSSTPTESAEASGYFLSDVDISFIGYVRPIYIPATIDAESTLWDIYNITYLNNSNKVQLQNDSVSFKYDQENQFEIFSTYDEDGYLKSEEFEALHKINDSLAIPKAKYVKTIYLGNKNVPIEKTEYKIYINYTVNNTSYLHNNEFLNLTPLTAKENDIRNVNLVKRKTVTSESILLFPNPAQDRLNIQIPENLGDDFHYSLYNSQGVKVMTIDNVAGTKHTINISELPPGVYFCRIKSPEVSFSKRITIQ